MSVNDQPTAYEPPGADSPTTESPPATPPVVPPTESREIPDADATQPGKLGAGNGGETASPTMLGRYEILGEIGRGGMGVVYRAIDPQLQRTVALKLMLGDDPEPDAIQRFLREGRISARLRHPNIVSVFDIDSVEGKLYFTMEWIDGTSLAHVLRNMGRLTPRAAFRIGRDIALALAYAHAQNCIHRDIKPSNILVTAAGAAALGRADDRETVIDLGKVRTSDFRVLVTDFGLAKDLTHETRLTQTGSVMGTPAYMSPEQAQDAGGAVGPAADQYSVGVLLYESISGNVPFAGTDPLQVLHQVVSTDPPRLSSRVPGLHPDVETIVARAIEKDPARRYAGCQQLAEDMERFLRGEPILARPIGTLGRLARRMRRNRPLVLALAGMLLILLAQLGAFVVWPRVSAAREARRAAAERQAREDAARAGLAEAERALAAGRVDDAIAAAQLLLETHADAGRRGEDVRIPAIHDLLSRAREEAHDSRGALLERYRAFRAALGRAESGEFLLKAARELVDRGQAEEALLLLRGRAWDAEPPRVRAESVHWHGRAREGIMDFRDAARRLESALADPDLPVELHADARAHLDFCRSFAREVADPLAESRLGVFDLDGDGRPEVVVREEQDLVVGRIEQGRWAPRVRASLGLTDRSRAFPAPGLGAAALVVTTPRSERGEIRIVALRGDRLECGAPVALPTSHLDTVCVLDLLGDDRPELVALLGGAKHLAVFEHEEGTHGLRPLLAAPVDSTIHGLQAFDADRDGRLDLVAAFGVWGGYGVRVLRFDPGRGFVPVHDTGLGIAHALMPVPGPSGPALAVATRWHGQAFAQMETIWGPETFRRRFRPAGIYLLEPAANGLTATTLLANEGEAAFDAGSELHSAHTPSGDWLFCNAGAFGRLGDWVVFRAQSPARPFARLAISRLPGAPGPLRRILDVDGDGNDELVVAGGNRHLGAESGPIEAAGEAGEEAAQRREATRAHPALFDYAVACERVGLDEEAARAYVQAAGSTVILAEVQAALEGQVRALARTGKAADIVAEVRQAYDRHPEAGTSTACAAVRLLDEGRWWSEAAEVATALSGRIDLPAAERAKYSDQAQRFRALAEWPTRLTLIGPDAAPLDWLATSPLPLVVGPDGSWTAYIASHAHDRVWLPLAGRWPSWRTTIRIASPLHEWGGSWTVGLYQRDFVLDDGAPPIGWYFGSGGATAAPLLHLDVHQHRVEDRLFDGRAMWGRGPMSLELTGIAHQNLLSARATGILDGTEVHSRVVSAAPTGDPVWAGIDFLGGPGAGSWSVTRIESFELAWTAEGVKPSTRPPVSALDHLLLANGRWIRNLVVEALPLYDLAIRLADLEETKEIAAHAAGLPVAERRWSPNGMAGHVGVDARVYRGLLRAAQGDDAGAQQDLADAWGKSAERFRALLELYGLALIEARPAELAALRKFWDRTRPVTAGSERRARDIRTIQEFGPMVASTLCDGLVPVVRVHVMNILPDSTWESTALRPGDFVDGAEGAPLRGIADLRQRAEEALRSGRATLRLRVTRQNQGFEVEAPARIEGVEIGESRGSVGFRD